MLKLIEKVDYELFDGYQFNHIFDICKGNNTLYDRQIKTAPLPSVNTKSFKSKISWNVRTTKNPRW
jgi:hypothetical protein